MPKAEKHILIVERIHRENPAVTTVRLNGDLSPALKHRRAGQFMIIRLSEDEGWSKPHPYTMSNAPEDPWLQLTCKAMGSFSTRIQSIAVGDRVQVAGPYGRFCGDIEEHTGAIMIAGGIGITPFLSVLRHFGNRGITLPITLFWANNRPEDFFGLDELSALTKSIGLKVVLVSVQPWSGSDKIIPGGLLKEQGYLTQALFQTCARPADTKIYLCGSDGMQNFVMRELSACRVDSKTVSTERFGTFTFEQSEQI